MKLHASCLIVGLVLAPLTVRASDFPRERGAVEIGELSTEPGDWYAVLYGNRDADPARLISRETDDEFIVDVDGDRYDDLVLVAPAGRWEDVDGDGRDELLLDVGGEPETAIVSLGTGEPATNQSPTTGEYQLQIRLQQGAR